MGSTWSRIRERSSRMLLTRPSRASSQRFAYSLTISFAAPMAFGLALRCSGAGATRRTPCLISCSVLPGACAARGVGLPRTTRTRPTCSPPLPTDPTIGATCRGTAPALLPSASSFSLARRKREDTSNEGRGSVWEPREGATAAEATDVATTAAKPPQNRRGIFAEAGGCAGTRTRVRKRLARASTYVAGTLHRSRSRLPAGSPGT